VKKVIICHCTIEFLKEFPVPVTTPTTAAASVSSTYTPVRGVIKKSSFYRK